jgi:hypothetical protein
MVYVCSLFLFTLYVTQLLESSVTSSVAVITSSTVNRSRLPFLSSDLTPASFVSDSGGEASVCAKCSELLIGSLSCSTASCNPMLALEPNSRRQWHSRYYKICISSNCF